MTKAIDLAGRKFGRLTAIRPTEGRKGGHVMWECVCDCGNTVLVDTSCLRGGKTKSCGCFRKECMRGKTEHIDKAAGTSVSMIKSKKLRSNNATGCTGVSFTKAGYLTQIGFQGRAYYLGVYSRFEDAVKVRKKAEALLHDETVDYYNLWRTKAEADPVWAEENPVQIRVERKGVRNFCVSFEPVL